MSDKHTLHYLSASCSHNGGSHNSTYNSTHNSTHNSTSNRSSNAQKHTLSSLFACPFEDRDHEQTWSMEDFGFAQTVRTSSRRTSSVTLLVTSYWDKEDRRKSCSYEHHFGGRTYRLIYRLARHQIRFTWRRESPNPIKVFFYSGLSWWESLGEQLGEQLGERLDTILSTILSAIFSTILSTILSRRLIDKPNLSNCSTNR